MKKIIKNLFELLNSKEFDKFRSYYKEHFHSEFHFAKLEGRGSDLHRDYGNVDKSMESMINYNTKINTFYKLLFSVAEGDLVTSLYEVTEKLDHDWVLTNGEIIHKGAKAVILQFYGIKFKEGKIYSFSRVADWLKQQVDFGVLSADNNQKVSEYYAHLVSQGLVQGTS